MARNTNREESLRIAAEKIRLKKEKEQREDKAFYERITTGTSWQFFKAIVVFCTLMALVTTVEVLFDGPAKKLTEKSWKIDQNWRYDGHAVLDVESYMFTPKYLDWGGHVESTLELIYSPIFQTGKKLSYDSIVNEDETVRHIEIRQRSIFTWFPLFQLFLLIPLVTFIFKRQSPWFNFARITSFVFVFPGTLLVIIFTML